MCDGFECCPGAQLLQLAEHLPQHRIAAHASLLPQEGDAQRELKDVPAGQSVQTEAPAVAAYLPASQGRQVSGEVALVVAEKVPVLQGLHVDVSPVPCSYVPGWHPSHDVAPAGAQYGSWQVTHVDAPARKSRSNTATQYDPDTSTAHAHHHTHDTIARTSRM